MHLITSSKLFCYTWVNKFTFTFLTWSVNGFSAVLVFRCSGMFRGVQVFRGVLVFRCSNVPGFSTCRVQLYTGVPRYLHAHHNFDNYNYTGFTELFLIYEHFKPKFRIGVFNRVRLDMYHCY